MSYRRLAITSWLIISPHSAFVSAVIIISFDLRTDGISNFTVILRNYYLCSN
ncbi:hypothetical protein [Vaccinium witches'-broom phytoplasma]|uniref:hypothetical protein n=1 Tax=Vaccinium witches'-broom phytoplasma TaxID=85642 RepID=UPI001375763A|nr:hypothetical protein [Vaccinium witches'-broom phytoplasma]